MQLHVDWLRNAKYSNDYITDGVIFVRRNGIRVPEDVGYKQMNSKWSNHLDEAFSLSPKKRIDKYQSISRVHAKTKITRYAIKESIYDLDRTVNQYVILNDEYSYLWNKWNVVLCTLQDYRDIQYSGLVGIYEDCILKAILSPVIVQEDNLFDKCFWINVDEQIGLNRFT